MNIIVVVSFFIAITWAYLNHDDQAYPDFNGIRAEAAALNMMQYKQSALSYYTANPSATGVIAASSLSAYLPVGYIKNYDWTANINGGYVYVYTSDTAAASAPSLAGTLASKSGDSFFAGVNHGGSLYSPSRGNTGITLPVAVPNNSPVLIGK